MAELGTNNPHPALTVRFRSIEDQFHGLFAEDFRSGNRKIFMSTIRHEGRRHSDRGEYPWISILIAIRSGSKVDFLGMGIREEVLCDLEDCVHGDRLCIFEERRA